MSEEPQTTPEQTPTEVAGNSPEARTETGELKNQSAATPTTETKSEHESTPSSESTEKKPEAAQGAPEKYADFKAPEGFDLDPKAVESALPLFKELNLSQDAAQRLVDFYAEQSKQAAEAPIKFYEQMRTDWRSELAKDRTIGNGSDDLSATTKQNVSAVMEALPQDLLAPFKEALDLTGAGDNPAIVRAINALGAQLREGTHVAGKGPSPLGQTNGAKPRSAASVIFPNLPSAAG